MTGSIPSRGLAGPFGISAAIHAAVVASALVALPDGPPRAMPAVYRVDIVAAPAGKRQVGTVGASEPAVPDATPVPAPLAAEPAVKAPFIPREATEAQGTKSTPAPAPLAPSTAARPAGGGPIGGDGTDVATVRTEGIDFQFPGYLNNIVRQIAVNFNPRDSHGRLRAEVMFLIRRDGSVSSFRFVTRSGAYSFDLEAQGAVEAAAALKAFGPLPEGFRDDVLPVFFSFDPRLIR